MTIAIDSINHMLSKRRNVCVLLTQAADTDIARSFWSVGVLPSVDSLLLLIDRTRVVVDVRGSGGGANSEGALNNTRPLSTPGYKSGPSREMTGHRTVSANDIGNLLSAR